MRMTWFDGLILAIVGISTYWSYSQGLILEIAFFAGTVLGLIGSFVGYPFVAPFFTSILGNSTLGTTVAFLFVFAFVGLLITIVGIILQKFVSGLALRGLDKLLGGAVGFVKAVIGVSVMVVLLTGIQSDNPPAYLRNSMLAEPIVNTTTGTMEQVPPIFDNFMEDYGKPSLKWIDSVKEQAKS